MISEQQRTESAIPNSNPTPTFVAIPLYEKNVKPSNGHQTDEDAVKAAVVATKKSDWSKVRTYRLSTHTPPRFKLRTSAGGYCISLIYDHIKSKGFK
jgi:hypothetical protein